MNTLKYKGFIGSVEYSERDEVFFGKIEGVNALVNFEGDSVRNLKLAFENAVEDYLAVCIEQGIAPRKSYTGVLNVRLTPQMHSLLAEMAHQTGATINALINGAVAEYTKHEHA